MLKYKKFEPKEYRNIVEDCWISFDCPECGEPLSTDSEADPVLCPKCCKNYVVSAILYHVEEVEVAQ